MDHHFNGPVVFRGFSAIALPEGTPSHCSSPPLQTAFRLPRLQRDVEAVTRPRRPLRPVKREEASENGATYEFGITASTKSK